eukprot:SAG31_NODE_5440_length_2537_cov_2.097211_2_plen_185_part_00
MLGHGSSNVPPTAPTASKRRRTSKISTSTEKGAVKSVKSAAVPYKLSEECDTDHAVSTQTSASTQMDFDAQLNCTERATSCSPTASQVDEITNAAALTADEISAFCSYCPHPEGHDELQDEINFVIGKASQDAETHMQPDPKYMQRMQKNQIKPYMRRMVFEWNLEVPQFASTSPQRPRSISPA